MRTQTWPPAPCESRWVCEWAISAGWYWAAPQVTDGYISLTPTTVPLPALWVAMAKFLELSENLSFPVCKVGVITVSMSHASDED